MAPDPSPLAVPADPTLAEIVTRLEDVLSPLGWEQPPYLVGIDSSAGLELCTPPPSADPIGDLVGFVAPDHWMAIGMLATGRTHDARADGGRRPETGGGPERRARVGHFVDRMGDAVGFFRLGDDPPEVHEVRGHAGRIDDVCRRSFALPTASPDHPLSAYWAMCWLERVLVEAERSPTHVATWARVARHHLVAPAGRGAPTVEALIDAGLELDRTGSWEALRVMVAGGRRVPTVDAAVARWMDEGMFARWMLEARVPLGALRTAVASVVPADVAAAVDVVLDAWGLP